MATASSRLPAVEPLGEAVDRPLVLRDHRPFDACAPRPSGTGRRACRAGAWIAASALKIGVVRGPNFIFFFIPIARSIGGCRRHVTLVPGPPIASYAAVASGASSRRATSYSSLYAISLCPWRATASVKRVLAGSTRCSAVRATSTSRRKRAAYAADW